MTRLQEEKVVTFAADNNWLRALRRYMLFVTLANLVWEFAHLPLYTLWETGTAAEMIFAATHCTGGDVLIAMASIMLALFLFGNPDWPASHNPGVIGMTVLTGLLYTFFSEWLNIEIRQSWAYRDLMPVIPILDTGLSPVLQWIVVPLIGFWWALRPSPKRHERTSVGV